DNVSAVVATAVAPTPSPAPTPPPPTSSTSGNLIADPGFESGASGFSAQNLTDSAVRSTTSPIAGAASLRININGWGNSVWWSKDVSGTALARASSLTV